MNFYVPVFSKIVDSSLWREPDFVVKVFITMLAKKDSDNVCRGSAFNISNWACKTEEEVLEALRILSSPDTRRVEPQPHDGKRIEKVEGGWFILNGPLYQQMMMDVNRRAYKTVKQRLYRGSEKKDAVHMVSTDVHKPESPPKPTKPTLTDSEWINSLSANPAYSGLDMAREHGKCSVWCEANHRKVTRRFFINWINRADKPMLNGSAHKAQPSVYELKSVIEAKTKDAQDLKNKYASEGPLTTDWSDPRYRDAYVALRKEIKVLNTRLGGLM